MSTYLKVLSLGYISVLQFDMNKNGSNGGIKANRKLVLMILISLLWIAHFWSFYRWGFRITLVRSESCIAHLTGDDVETLIVDN